MYQGFPEKSSPVSGVNVSRPFVIDTLLISAGSPNVNEGTGATPLFEILNEPEKVKLLSSLLFPSARRKLINETNKKFNNFLFINIIRLDYSHWLLEVPSLQG